MNAFRRFFAVTLVASLIFSDMMAFWHVGSCHCAVADQPASVTTSGPVCAHGCSHGENPFAKRRQNLGQDVRDEDALTAEVHETASSSSSQSSHDSDNCTLCRWLFTARESLAIAEPALPCEHLCFAAPVLRDWAEPVRELRGHDLSRRGPPATSQAA
jgi:hypothetical protein